MCLHASMLYKKEHEYLLAYIKVHKWCIVTIEHVFCNKKPDIVFCLCKTPSCDQLVYSNNEYINTCMNNRDTFQHKRSLLPACKI